MNVHYSITFRRIRFNEIFEVFDRLHSTSQQLKDKNFDSKKLHLLENLEQDFFLSLFLIEIVFSLIYYYLSFSWRVPYHYLSCPNRFL